MPGNEFSNRRLPVVDFLNRAERVKKPVPQAPPAHTGCGDIEQGKERAFFSPFEDILNEFEIPLCLWIEKNKIFATVRLWGFEMRQERLLGLFDVAEEHPGGDERTSIGQS